MSQADRLNRQARVLAAVQENTQAVINSSSNELPGIHAGTIAETLRMDRANDPQIPLHFSLPSRENRTTNTEITAIKRKQIQTVFFSYSF